MERGSVRYLCQQTDSAAYGFERSKNKNSGRDFAAGEPDGAGFATRIEGSDRILSLIPASIRARALGQGLALPIAAQAFAAGSEIGVHVARRQNLAQL